MELKYAKERFGDSLTCGYCGIDPFEELSWFEKFFNTRGDNFSFLYKQLMEESCVIDLTCDKCGNKSSLTKDMINHD